MRLAIINTLAVPSGNASVNRFLGYGKELVNLGAEVSILSSSSFEDSVLDGIKIHSCGKNTTLIGALFNMIKSVKKERYNAIIIVSNSLLLIYPLWVFCKINKIKFLQEKSEFPFVLQKRGLLAQMYAALYVNTTYKLFDGLIVMTKPLLSYLSDKVNKKCQMFEMPMTVDTDRFDIDRTETEYGDYIAYCGDMAGNKDGVINLIEAFDKASPIINNVNLLLIGGSSNKSDLEKVIDLVSSKNNNRIILFGKATRDQIPVLLKNASALALARPSSLQSTGGFPTKLGEYLATGNPVVVTSVGDIPQYLNDTNSYLVPPDDIEKFTEAIISVFRDMDHARIVGEKGKELANTVFSTKFQSRRLYNYLESLCE